MQLKKRYVLCQMFNIDFGNLYSCKNLANREVFRHRLAFEYIVCSLLVVAGGFEVNRAGYKSATKKLKTLWKA